MSDNYVNLHQTPLPESLKVAPDYKYAGFFVRFAALIVDAMLFTLPVLFIKKLVDFNILNIDVIKIEYFFSIIYFPYFIILTWQKGQTLGKRLFNIKVIREKGEVKITTALLRELLGRTISNITILSYLMVCITKKKKGIHDKIAGTVVVHTKPLNNLQKVLKWITVLTVPILLTYSFVNFTYRFQDDQTKIDLRDGLKSKLSIIQVSKPITDYFNDTFEMKEWCTKEKIKDCSTEKMSTNQLKRLDSEVNQVINKIIQYQSELEEERRNMSISPTPSITPSKSIYSCPESEYVNCMPGPGAVNEQCSPEYLEWATKNCPGFEGAAY